MTATPEQQTLAQAIRQQRELLGLTQAEAARRAGISRQCWCDTENGRRKGNTDTLLKMDRVLKFTPGSLSAMEHPIPAHRDEYKALQRQLFGMIEQLTSIEELERARVELTRLRLEAVAAELDAYKAAAHERTGEGTTTAGR